MKTAKQKAWDYFILTARVLIALVFIDYGYGKLTGGQFGLSPEQLTKPVKDLGLFNLSWYLFDQEPFKSFIGITQIIAGILLLFNRTVILGCILALPILANILVIDITYIKMEGFYWRLSFYILLDLLILWHYREQMKIALATITKDLPVRSKFPLWTYLLLPVMAFALEFLSTIPKILTNLVIRPHETIMGLKAMPALVMEVIKKICS